MQFPTRRTSSTCSDTPGHEDFSEDTYRTLTAVDSAVMVIDSRSMASKPRPSSCSMSAACAIRPSHLITNKLDREGRLAHRAARRNRGRA
ncbi:GTP-binding protein [Cupriavidus basilensis]